MCTTIPSLQPCLMVEPGERRASSHQKAQEGWTMQELVGSGEVAVPCPDRALTLEDIYDGLM